ncbi:smc c-terminal domain protein [Ichthyophthirius multifiliis]|uniref:Smc c-terminal domain protein n=1 Tax=Ichthyophthirius multifiliis TaxID=5932 RepID=G0QPB0_ICHMU|nr:smc c-terminal domain protein [Ichthyophthirius multifiliis]EGR32947.1 smc c-terminal domain protein [Ichthyophthirius multifiliis]|eukprot:XP_004036933.1 smc c-terminal domain protein [Ichthyophthirius multifiliis]
MQIHYLELTDFKSFRGKHQVGPFENLTAIIGPNGCGKSNIIDSLCFVFNVENARNHNPISSLKDGQRPQQCSVEAFLYTDEQKNTIVSFRRLQTRKRQFIYYYNNNEITEEEYIDQLATFKIGPEVFMLQGESDKLIKKIQWK